MAENSMFEHELEQMKIALAQTLFEEIGLNVCEALEMAGRYCGDSMEVTDYGNSSLREGDASGNLYGSGWY